MKNAKGKNSNSSTSATPSASAAASPNRTAGLATGKNPSTSKPARTPREFTHEEIADRAKRLWENRGRPEGRDEEIWLEAERELREADERRFANPDELLDPDGNPNDDVDRRLDELARPPGDRSATSL
jgi:hypothetical protein